MLDRHGLDSFAMVRASWDADTAWVDNWNPRNPARGQCGTTALVLQDEGGGNIVRGIVDGRVVHYWNMLDGWHVDLTWQQFPPWARVAHRELISRDDILVNPWFTDRYLELRTRIADATGAIK